MAIGAGTVDSWSGTFQFLTTIHSLGSPTSSHLEGNAVMFNQNSVDSLAQVEEINEKYEVESGMSLDVKGNLKKN